MPESSQKSWSGRALIVGAGGIGEVLASQLADRCPHLTVTLCRRKPKDASDWPLDLENSESLSWLTQTLSNDHSPLRLVFNATGRLHGPSLQPEKRLQHVQSDALIESFKINAAAPLLLAKAIEPSLRRDQPFHYASLSARVGSMGSTTAVYIGFCHSTRIMSSHWAGVIGAPLSGQRAGFCKEISASRQPIRIPAM